MAMPAEQYFASRHAIPEAIDIPDGFRVEVVAFGLNNPYALEFDEDGNVFVAEMGSPSPSAYTGGRLVRVGTDGSLRVVADGFEGSITGITYYEGNFYIIEAGISGRVYWIAPDGTKSLVLDGIPGGGDHQTSGIIFAHSGRMYFGQGTRTNAGVVGVDNRSWLMEHPEMCDIPSKRVVLSGKNYLSANPFGGESLWTGAFKQLGVGDYEGETIEGRTLSTGSVLRADPDGGDLEVFAWGFRAPVGICAHPDGRIFCTDTGMEDEGSRRVAGGEEYIWHVREGIWYGWPDFLGGLPVTDERFKPEGAAQPEFLLKVHPSTPVYPVARFPMGSGLGQFDFSRSPFFGSDDLAFIPMAGRLDTTYADKWLGSRIVQLDVATGDVEGFAKNRVDGPASTTGGGGFEHPVAIKFDRTGESMYVLDLGITAGEDDEELHTLPSTGVLWRITPEEIA